MGDGECVGEWGDVGGVGVGGAKRDALGRL